MKAESNNTSATFIEDHSTCYETGKMKKHFFVTVAVTTATPV